MSSYTQIGKIKCLDKIVDNSKRWVILFHGYGADAYDLQSLSDVLETSQPCNWLFPQGILEVPIGPGWRGRAWWNIDLMDLQKRQNDPNFDFSTETPPGLEHARQLTSEMLEKLMTDHQLNWSDIVLGGFSQGAMLAVDLFLHAKENPKGLLLFSGALINKQNLKPLLAQRAGCTYFLSHGISDPVIPVRSGQQLEGFLSSGGMKGRLHTFQGSHEIPMEIIMKANEYLKGLS